MRCLFGKLSARRLALAACCAALTIALAVPARAQYDYDPANADEQPQGVRLFGVVKEERGAFVDGATIIVDQRTYTYVLTSNVAGQYASSLPLDVQPDTLRVSCAKPGYKFIRLTRQAGGPDKKKWVEVNCVLRRGA
ncbi:MAG TPA: hypothetical protein VG735_01375 [Caulobacterales bacterium]|jgi:hypothetical protein|nr:hypothetical protein [Caulobacterales bacterium]